MKRKKHTRKRASSFDHEKFSLICKALAHPSRVIIIEHLKRVNKCICGQIVNILPIAQSTVSQHLKILKESGLIKGDVDGPRTCYCLNEDALKAFKRSAAAF